jgi:hypothetical protein
MLASLSTNALIYPILTQPTRRNAPVHKAWTGGSNPITQRAAAGPGQSNGVQATTKIPASNNKMNNQKDAGLTDKHANDRTIYLLGGALVRSPATLRRTC